MLLIMQYEKEDPGMLFTTGRYKPVLLFISGRYNPVFNVYFWQVKTGLISFTSCKGINRFYCLFLIGKNRFYIVYFLAV